MIQGHTGWVRSLGNRAQQAALLRSFRKQVVHLHNSLEPVHCKLTACPPHTSQTVFTHLITQYDTLVLSKLSKQKGSAKSQEFKQTINFRVHCICLAVYTC